MTLRSSRTPAIGDNDVNRRLIVLQSFGPPSATSNPYVQMLIESLEPHITVRTFTWRTALSANYDVLHIHWPERLLRGRSGLTTAVRIGLFVTVLLTTRLRKQAIVRTIHNTEPHESGRRLERLVLGWCDRRTGLWVRLNGHTVAPTAAPMVTILHGHYRDVVEPNLSGETPSTSARLVFFGLIRAYKGLAELLAAFGELADSAATLHIVGRPIGTGVESAVIAAARSDSRITVQLEFVPQEELVEEILMSRLVVLPYHTMHNSGAALLALSLNRSVLVPRNDVTSALADEVGAEWVLRYRPPLTAQALADALRRAAANQGPPPDLSRRDWGSSARLHADAYRVAATAREQR